MSSIRISVITDDTQDDRIEPHQGDNICPSGDPDLPRVGVVVIGRNEGQRLIDCLHSLKANRTRTVYVDSGSVDGSPLSAAKLADVVLQLDMTIPFTAARARNLGFETLIRRWPETDFVQFIDGDCLLDEQWLRIAANFLIEHERIGLVFGRRRERYPERTIFNALCDREWDGPPGAVQECGGDILIRAAALRKVGGYSSRLIAGEEPELCIRLRGEGWLIWRLASEMTFHDADITRFGQWWRRSKRSGYAYAQVSLLHRKSPFRIWIRNLWRSVFWGGFVPVLAVTSSVVHPAALWILALYPIQILRLAWRQSEAADARWINAVFDVLGKFPEMQGVLQFYINKLMKRRQAIIEYK